MMTPDTIQSICTQYQNDAGRLLDIALHIQERDRHISDEAVTTLADALGLSVAAVESTLSFYHFLSRKPRGTYTIYLNDSVVSHMTGFREVCDAFQQSLGCKMGETTSDGLIGLYTTPCIGMSDQEPAALINQVVFPNLTPFRAREIVQGLQRGLSPEDLRGFIFGTGHNAHPLIRAVVSNHIRKAGPVLNPGWTPGDVLDNRLRQMSPHEVIREIRSAQLRGRGGAGFPTGLKWLFCREASGDKKYVFCNADEGEPGTFKDRVLLTEKPAMVLEGMVIAAFATGASEGILYLRYEYGYLRNYLEETIRQMREQGYLGHQILGIAGFDFDIRIQSGAGSYVCGEESALIESAEGNRGEPRPRPPFPVEMGYKGCPTVVNNVETLCAVVNILTHGHAWYLSQGTETSTGTKLLSISGDCRYPGVYEVEWDCRLSDILDMAGAQDVQAVQVGGPSGMLVWPEAFHKVLGYNDLATGGSIIIFDRTRDLVHDVAIPFLDFFIAESCGACVPCRNIPALLRQKLEQIMAGKGTAQDLDDLDSWSRLMRVNRCGLGHTAANPVVSLLQHFPHLLEERIRSRSGKRFDLDEATTDALTFSQQHNRL